MNRVLVEEAIGSWCRSPVEIPGRESYQQLLAVEPDGKVRVRYLSWDAHVTGQNGSHYLHYGETVHGDAGRFLEQNLRVTPDLVQQVYQRLLTTFAQQVSDVLPGILNIA
jgi:hypothetical protein